METSVTHLQSAIDRAFLRYLMEHGLREDDTLIRATLRFRALLYEEIEEQITALRTTQAPTPPPPQP